MADLGDQYVNDLVWVVNSPSFVTGPEVAPHVPVTADQVDRSALVEFVAGRSVRRVGRYFEALVLFWLTDVRKVEVVGHSLQVRDEQRTLGEVDFLFVDEAGLLVHCEVSVKFYLHQPQREGSHFPGPNSTDDFENKVGRLFSHQLELSREHFPEVERREALVRGRLFTHAEPDRSGSLVRPERMAADCLAGSWLRADEAHELEQLWGNAQMRIADKPFWLTPVLDAPFRSGGGTAAAVAEHFTDSDRTLMIAVTHPDTGDEIDRVCVVPADWDR